jgi:hypothetical protein
MSESKAIESRKKNFDKLSHKEQLGVIQKVDGVARRFPRTYRLYCQILELLKLKPKNLRELYGDFMKENPYVQNDSELDKNLYVPYSAGEAESIPFQQSYQGELDKHVHLTVLPHPDAKNTDPQAEHVIGIDDMIKELEQGLSELRQSIEV